MKALPFVGVALFFLMIGYILPHPSAINVINAPTKNLSAGTACTSDNLQETLRTCRVAKCNMNIGPEEHGQTMAVEVVGMVNGKCLIKKRGLHNVDCLHSKEALEFIYSKKGPNQDVGEFAKKVRSFVEAECKPADKESSG